MAGGHSSQATGVPGGFLFVGLPGFAVPYRDASDVTDGRTDEGAGFGLSI